MYPESKCQPIQEQMQEESIYSCHYNCSAWDKYAFLLELLLYFMNHIAENKSYFGLFLSQKHHSLSWGKQRQKTSSQPSKAVDHVLYVPHINILCTLVCTDHFSVRNMRILFGQEGFEFAQLSTSQLGINSYLAKWVAPFPQRTT